MRGFKTLKCRFNLTTAISNNPRVLEVVIDSTLFDYAKSHEHIVCSVFEVTEERIPRRNLYTYQLSIAEAERLVGFLDAGLLEHRRRLESRPLPGANPENDTVPRERPTPVQDMHGNWQCELCLHHYHPYDVDWRPEFGHYICGRNYNELLGMRTLTADGGGMITPRPTIVSEEERIP